MQTTQNQALTMYPLFFDPEYKKAEFCKKDGKPYISYRDDFWGVRVEEDGSVTFTMHAPMARTVEVSGFGGSMGAEKITLVKDEDGFFSKKVKGIAPGFHYHRWFVDGVQVTNPNAPFTYGCFGVNNFFEMPKAGEDFWFLKEAAHGDVQIHTYGSSQNGHLKRCYVYLPPSFGKEAGRKYPVMYILHGVGESETGWLWNGKLNFILDNLIAEKKAEEMLVVMCCGYAFKDDEDPIFFPGDFAKELAGNVIPYVEKHFPVKKDRNSRAMAGLSLGSAQATQIVSRYQEMFAHLGVFSGVRDEETERIIEACGRYPMQTVLMTAGKGEKGLDERQKLYTDRFAAMGTAGGQRCYEGYHEWHVWRESLRDFAELIFREEKNDLPKAGEIKPAPEAADSCGGAEYSEPAVCLRQLDAQTFAEHMLMFDPIHKGLIPEVDEKGRPNGRYKEEHPGAEILDVKNGTARFWFRADGAETVETDIWGMGRFALRKTDDDGWWSVDVSGIEKGFHYYGCLVNGTEVVDSNAPVGYGGFRAVNYLEMPEEDFEEYRIRQVPHGTVHFQYYPSNITGRTRLCYVYTPASYEENTDRRYPALYLQHGGGENEVGWLWQGKLANIADNLIAQGVMEESVIVMTTGYAFPKDGNYHHAMSAFLRELPECCVPFIDRTYRTIADRQHRGMAGLSMGGMQTQRIVFEHPELFAWAGIFSGGLVIKDDEVDYSGVLLNPKAFKESFRMLFVACGTEESIYGQTAENERKVLEAGVPIEVFEGYGYHDWTFWRHCLNAFLRKVFR